MAMEGWGEEGRVNLSILYSKVAFILFFIGPEAILWHAHVVKVHFVAEINSVVTPGIVFLTEGTRTTSVVDPGERHPLS